MTSKSGDWYEGVKQDVLIERMSQKQTKEGGSSLTH